MPTQPPGYPATNSFLLTEDEAIKKLVSNITVPGVAKTVPVWFRFPDSERQIVYPFITIDMIGIDPAYDLWTSTYLMGENFDPFEDEATATVVSYGLHEPSVSPNVFTVPNGPDPAKPLRRKNYLPYRIYYQITTWSKTFAHDRVLTAKLMRDVIMPRDSWLRVDADGTWKRLEPLGWSPADLPTQEGNVKRIFRKAFTVSLQTEIPQDDVSHIEQQAAIQQVAMRGYMLDTNEEWTRDESHVMPGDHGWEIVAEHPSS